MKLSKAFRVTAAYTGATAAEFDPKNYGHLTRLWNDNLLQYDKKERCIYPCETQRKSKFQFPIKSTRQDACGDKSGFSSKKVGEKQCSYLWGGGETMSMSGGHFVCGRNWIVS